MLHGTYDAEADAAYIHLGDPDAMAVDQVEIPDTPSGALMLDFDADGRLVGLEILGATGCLAPALLATLQSKDQQSKDQQSEDQQ